VSEGQRTSAAAAGGTLDAPLLRQILENLADGVVLLSAVRDDSGAITDFAYRYMNQSFERLLGKAADDVIGHTLLELFPSHVELGLFQAYRDVVETGTPLTMTIPDFDENGVEASFEVTAAKVGDGYVVVGRDVTERLAIQRRLAESEERYRAIFRDSGIGKAVLSPQGRFVEVNPALCEMLGYSAEALTGVSFGDVTHPEDLPFGLEQVDRLRRGQGRRFHQRKRYLHADGSTVWADVTVSAIRDEQGDLIYFVAQLVDIEDMMAAQEELRRRTEQYRLLAENASDVVYQTTPDGIIQWISPSVRSVLGWDPEDLVGTVAVDLLAPADRDLVNEARGRVYGGEQSPELMVRFRTTSGGYVTMSTAARPVRDSSGRVVGAVVGLRDVTERELARRALERSERLFRLAMDGAPQGMAVLSLDLRFEMVNRALCDLLACDEAWIVERSLADVMHDDDRADLGATRRRLVAGSDDHDRIESRLVAADGSVVWVQRALGLLRGDAGEPLFFVLQVSDETAARQLREDLAYRATHDVLTGLANRDDMLTRLRDTLAAPAPAPGHVAVLFGDLDNLKDINDTHGHVAGDQVLSAVAARMSQVVRSTDVVSRVGGDEFVVVLGRVETLEEARTVADKIHQALVEPIVVSRHGLPDVSVRPTLSIGLALAEAGEEPEHVLRRADLALYDAKHAGRDRTIVAGGGLV
jgi:diguanylate cyclase